MLYFQGLFALDHNWHVKQQDVTPQSLFLCFPNSTYKCFYLSKGFFFCPLQSCLHDGGCHQGLWEKIRLFGALLALESLFSVDWTVMGCLAAILAIFYSSCRGNPQADVLEACASQRHAWKGPSYIFIGMIVDKMGAIRCLHCF